MESAYNSLRIFGSKPIWDTKGFHTDLNLIGHVMKQANNNLLRCKLYYDYY